MDLPLTKKELDAIILILKKYNPHLYAKLWTHKMSNLNKEKNNGFS
jgi:hypothetical protein